MARKCPNAKIKCKNDQKNGQKVPKNAGMAKLTPESNSTPKIAIETGLRPFYSHKNDPDAPTSGYRL